jgi:DNA-binding CsgD family transcriptional regulator
MWAQNSATGSEPARETALPRRNVAIIAVLGLVTLALVMTPLDAGVDAGQTLLMMFAVAMPVLHLSRPRERTGRLETAQACADDEGREWRRQSRRFFAGLSRAIEIQLSAWNRSAAEADVAGLLKKGASMREFARLRRISEATIRQQAQCIYRKPGLASHSELLASFMEDVFAPGEATFQPGSELSRPGRFDA